MPKIKLHPSNITTAVKQAGISSPLKDYRLSYYINRSAGINLCRKSMSCKLPHKPDTIINMHYYVYEDIENDIIIRLFKNYQGNNLLIPAAKKADYILTAEGADIPEAFWKNLLVIIREIQHIQYTFVLSPDKYNNIIKILQY